MVEHPATYLPSAQNTSGLRSVYPEQKSNTPDEQIDAETPMENSVSKFDMDVNNS